MTLRPRFLLVWGIGVAMVAVCALLAVADKSLAQSRPSPSYCEAYARDSANRNSHYSSGGGALGGAARGAAGGAIFGAITGNAGRGAAVGAGVGAVVGGARKANSQQYYYDQAYRDCMAGRY
jgi:predicted lipid-binding transport protein (Tim44 family)